MGTVEGKVSKSVYICVNTNRLINVLDERRDLIQKRVRVLDTAAINNLF